MCRCVCVVLAVSVCSGESRRQESARGLGGTVDGVEQQGRAKHASETNVNIRQDVLKPLVRNAYKNGYRK